MNSPGAGFVRRQSEPEAAEVAVAVIDDWPGSGVSGGLSIKHALNHGEAEGPRSHAGPAA
jgi:hypothetical protein